MLTSRQIRQQFIDYFVQKHSHAFVPSSPVVPHDDPTLLFTNAGMNQFKPYFLGTQAPPWKRVANTQKCIRAGGKHNDLEDVGKDTYHHTFFEMLGNWSFGDYFKKESIAWGWDLLVNVWKLDPTRLHATYFQGDKSEGLAPDDEAREIWANYLPGDHIHPGNKKDNFWEMGDTGPCGPCSEIHYDKTPGMTGGKLVNAGTPDVIEIWNHVFIQFNRGADKKLSPLPAKHIDTGMGFERICAVIQGKQSNYDTDLFTPYFTAIQKITGAPVYAGSLEKPQDIAYRVIADHIRTLTFALADGAHCGNDGRNYVLRRILRRAVYYGRQNLGAHNLFFHKLVPTVVEQMGDIFVEVRQKQDEIIAELREEEEAFSRTLDRGLALFEEYAERANKTFSGSLTITGTQPHTQKKYVDPLGRTWELPVISGKAAFELYSTSGFPPDLTRVMAEKRQMIVDLEGFEQEMERHRVQSRASDSETVNVHSQLVEIVQRDKPPATEFHGYTQTKLDAVTKLWLYCQNGSAYEPAASAKHGDHVAVVVERSPFYAESGGQVGDTGTIENRFHSIIRVNETVRVGDVFFHLGKVERGDFVSAADDSKPHRLTVDADRRARVMANHTMTHVMNHKLRAVLGEHVQQKGSLVDDQKTRFDFSHNAAVTPEAIEKIESLVNADIAADLPVHADFAPQQDALKIHGLRAVFGEKYPPTVRIVSIGPTPQELLKDPSKKDWFNYSIEFCGGTHLASTGDAEGFVIVSEEGVAKGVRRLTAITGPLAHKASATAAQLLSRARALKSASSSPEQLSSAVAEITGAMNQEILPLLQCHQLRDALAELQKIIKEHDKAKSKESAGNAVELARQIADANEGPIIVAEIPGADPDALRTAMDVIRKKKPDAALLLGAASGDKVSFVAAVPESLIKKGLKAGDWVKEAAKITGGGGGGRPDMAQAGGKDPAKLHEALHAAKQFASKKVS